MTSDAMLLGKLKQDAIVKYQKDCYDQYIAISALSELL